MVASHVLPTGDLASNPGMCPDWESNQRPFGLQAGTQSTEPHQPGLQIKNFVGGSSDGSSSEIPSYNKYINSLERKKFFFKFVSFDPARSSTPINVS